MAMGHASCRLRPCWADPLRPQETRLRPPARPLLPRCASVFPAIFFEPPPQGSGLSIFREPPEVVQSRLRRPRGPCRLPESDAAWSSRVRRPSFFMDRPPPPYDY
ncbi:hypothetical protein NDU88_006081 [Pleurodeles waltl]|uniref:Uncharacterized protein n=1 Tax=Pleurodeles waltl TaxID=8319 RepID=A0AAV7RR44_PLEWA|nr:hypothetical protein NDU88_006081 [Pleurodeles waltl]